MTRSFENFEHKTPRAYARYLTTSRGLLTNTLELLLGVALEDLPAPETSAYRRYREFSPVLPFFERDDNTGYVRVLQYAEAMLMTYGEKSPAGLTDPEVEQALAPLYRELYHAVRGGPPATPWILEILAQPAVNEPWFQWMLMRAAAPKYRGISPGGPISLHFSAHAFDQGFEVELHLECEGVVEIASTQAYWPSKLTKEQCSTLRDEMVWVNCVDKDVDRFLAETLAAYVEKHRINEAFPQGSAVTGAQ